MRTYYFAIAAADRLRLIIIIAPAAQKTPCLSFARHHHAEATIEAISARRRRAFPAIIWASAAHFHYHFRPAFFRYSAAMLLHIHAIVIELGARAALIFPHAFSMTMP